jgi:molecular chaperone GrpE
MEHPEDSDFDPTSADYRDSRSSDSDDDFARGTQSAGGAPLQDANEGVSAPAADLVRRFSEQQDKYLRLAAEYENFRKRTARERAETVARAQADVLRELLDGLDDLSRFAHVDPASVDAATLVQGVSMVEKKMLKTLANAGLEIVDPVDQTFDPTLHEAVTTEPALSPEDDHVVARVYQVGYLFNGQLLRPARVAVKQWNG